MVSLIRPNVLLKAVRQPAMSFARQPVMSSTRAFSSFRFQRPSSILATLEKQTSRPLSATFFKQSRSIMTDSTPVTARPSESEAWKRYALAGGTVAATIIAVNAFFNRETRDALAPEERGYLNKSFMYTGVGLTFTAVTARSFFRSGFAYRIMSMNPWAVLGLGLLGSISTMMGVFFTPPENTVLKHTFWLGFNVCQAATLCPLFFFSPAVLSRAALYTVGVVGALSYVGATAKTDKYLYLGGPLLAGITVVALSSLAPMALPLGLRGLAVSEAISVYGGLAVFGGFILYDTQKILQHGRMAAAGLIPADPVRESVGLELDMINIFIRLVQILSMSGQRRQK